MSAFQSLATSVMRATRLNPDYFAQTVTYRTADGESQEIAAHVRHDIRIRVDPDTNDEEVIEQIHVELDRGTIPLAPDFGTRILLAGDDQAYLYAYKGKHRFTSWKATFERRRQTQQGV
jgi:hypothetical protein